MIFLFKQKTAYEMRISDWSSDVCSSDLYVEDRHEDGDSRHRIARHRRHAAAVIDSQFARWRHFPDQRDKPVGRRDDPALVLRRDPHRVAEEREHAARKSAVEGKRVAVRVDIGGGRNINKKKKKNK